MTALAAMVASPGGRSSPGGLGIGYVTEDGADKQTRNRHERSTLWFGLYRRGGRVILHHGHIRPVLIRAWLASTDGIEATIRASQTTMHPGPPARDSGKPARPHLAGTLPDPLGG